MTISSAILLTTIVIAASDPAPHPVDDILERAWQANDVTPAATCSDDAFLRRVSLDLIGRIPTLDELRRFRTSRDRTVKVDELLASESFPEFQAEMWTAILVGYANAFDSNRTILRDWLAKHFAGGESFDNIARSLIAAEGESAFSGPVNFLIRHPEDAVVKVSRVFLGVRLDCARCHDHPFDRWTEEDFERMRLFFEATERRELSENNFRLVNIVREHEPGDGPRFLTGARPRTSRWRDEFALFTTHSKPFARAFANRLWYQLTGRGIVHPVDDFSRDNPPAVPELLEFLANEARRTNFDLRAMIRLICTSRAYGLDSAVAAKDNERISVFARGTIRPLMAEQLVDSMNLALGREMHPEERTEFIETTVGTALDEDFGSTWEYRETVQQLMNRLVGRIVVPGGQVAELYDRILTRPPNGRELELCRERTATDIAFALIHSNEFRFNH